LEPTPVTDCMQLGRPKRVNWLKTAGRLDYVMYPQMVLYIGRKRKYWRLKERRGEGKEERSRRVPHRRRWQAGLSFLGIFSLEIGIFGCTSALHVPGCTVCDCWGGTADWCKGKLRSDEMVVTAMLLLREG
jgi:hypothetical protein